MTTTISHWGNSLGIRIPATVARQAGITAGRDVTFDVQDGNIIVRPISWGPDDIEALISRITTENRHEPIFSTQAVGNEQVVW